MSSRPDLRAEDGITIVEAMIAAAILLVVLLAGFLAMESSSNATKSAERQAIAAAAGERELDRLAGLPYAQIVHCTAPAHDPSAGAPAGQVPRNPAHHVVNGTPRRFNILADYRKPGSAALAGTSGGEVLAVRSTNCALTAPDTPFSSGGVTGTVWRYVTIRRDSCPPSLPSLTAPLNGLLTGTLQILTSVLNSITASIGAGVNIFCSAPQDSKRITVAVVVDKASTLGPRNPMWMSTIVTSESAGLVLDESGQLDF